MLTHAADALEAIADPERAAQMAAYLKTDMPFYGVSSPNRKPIARHIVKEYRPSSQSEYEQAVRALWNRPTREEKYLALDYAMAQRDFIGLDSMDLYESLVREGQWWDLVDGIASHLVGGAFQRHRAAVTPMMKRWVDDDDMWIRRTAILSQLRHTDDTDEQLLFDFCERRCHEKEFFIRKAIGWSLRSYARTNPEAVIRFLEDHRSELSGLSFREAAKHLFITQ